MELILSCKQIIMAGTLRKLYNILIPVGIVLWSLGVGAI